MLAYQKVLAGLLHVGYSSVGEAGVDPTELAASSYVGLLAEAPL